MKKYFLVYQKILVYNFSELTSNKSHFWGSTIGSVVWGIFSIIFIMILTSRTSSVYGWTREELYILTGIYNAIMGMFFFLFSRNFNQFASFLHFGQFDTILTKPIDSQFYVSTRYISYPGLFRVVLGLGFTSFMLNRIGVSVNAIDIISFLLLSILGAFIVYALWFLVMTITFWNSMLSNLVDFMYSINGIARFPREMFIGAREMIFILFVPLTYVINVPAHALLHRLTFTDISILVVLTGGLLLAARIFWLYAIRSYSSASS